MDHAGYQVALDVFEGPLDLLLHLVKKHELSILDIPISFVTEKYLAYLDAMAALWGTDKGPAARTRQPPDYERRIVVMQSYLGHDDFRILSDAPDGSDARHAIQVQLRRQACTWTVPFTVIRLTDGAWIINQLDLTAAGNPARGCAPSATDSAAAGP